MYAVIKTGGKQYKVEEGDILQVEKLDGASGDEITLDSVLMVGSDETTSIGRPVLESASVKATIVKQDKHAKIMILKKKRRKDYRRLTGHRQPYTELKITSIES